MRVFIPPLSSYLRLLQPWTFEFPKTYHGTELFNALYRDPNIQGYQHLDRSLWPDSVTLEADTILKVDRVRIIKNTEPSVTFRIMGGPDTRLLSRNRGGTAYDSVRFTAALSEVNLMDVVISA